MASLPFAASTYRSKLASGAHGVATSAAPVVSTEGLVLAPGSPTGSRTSMPELVAEASTLGVAWSHQLFFAFTGLALRSAVATTSLKVLQDRVLLPVLPGVPPPRSAAASSRRTP